MKTIADFGSHHHVAAALIDAGYDDRSVQDVAERLTGEDSIAGDLVLQQANRLEEQVKCDRMSLRVAESNLKAFCSVFELEPVNA